MQKELLTRKDVTSIGEEISHEMAADFVVAYQKANPNDIAGYTIGRKLAGRSKWLRKSSSAQAEKGRFAASGLALA